MLLRWNGRVKRLKTDYNTVRGLNTTQNEPQPHIVACKLLINNRCSVLRIDIIRENIMILEPIDIFLHPYLVYL